MDHTIRAVRHDDWTRVKQIRLDSLRDPVAHLAFLETHEQAAAKPDDFWQGRAAGAAEGTSARQFVAEAVDGRWLGTVSVLIERPGVQGVFGNLPEQAQTHIVGVFVRPEARGTGLAEELFRAALEWSWSIAEPRIERVRLFVHEDNARAAAMYGKVGFKRTDVSVPVPGDPTRREIELALVRG
jgi:RimJ/RimL family protein N-acetyltransferase